MTILRNSKKASGLAARASRRSASAAGQQDRTRQAQQRHMALSKQPGEGIDERIEEAERRLKLHLA